MTKGYILYAKGMMILGCPPVDYIKQPRDIPASKEEQEYYLIELGKFLEERKGAS